MMNISSFISKKTLALKMKIFLFMLPYFSSQALEVLFANNRLTLTNHGTEWSSHPISNFIDPIQSPLCELSEGNSATITNVESFDIETLKQAKSIEILTIDSYFNSTTFKKLVLNPVTQKELTQDFVCVSAQMQPEANYYNIYLKRFDQQPLKSHLFVINKLKKCKSHTGYWMKSSSKVPRFKMFGDKIKFMKQDNGIVKCVPVTSERINIWQSKNFFSLKEQDKENENRMKDSVIETKLKRHHIF